MLNFIRSSISPGDVRGKSVLEVGSLDFNGSARTVLAEWSPARYTGVDMYFSQMEMQAAVRMVAHVKSEVGEKIETSSSESISTEFSQEK